MILSGTSSNWLHDCLVDYPRTVAPLQAKLDVERKRIGRRSRNALNVTLEWTEKEKSTYADVLALIATSALRSFPSDDDEVCVFTDVSLDGYIIVVTLVHHWDDAKHVDKQIGTFKANQRGWRQWRKKYFLSSKHARSWTTFCSAGRVFDFFVITLTSFPFAPRDELRRHVRDRLQRWAMRLCGLMYSIEHIPGEQNVWDDIVSRIRLGPLSSVQEAGPLGDVEFVFPTLADIFEAQLVARRARASLPVDIDEVDGVACGGGRPWIPITATDLLARLLVVAHCGAQDHRGVEPMVTVLAERFYIVKLHAKESKFVRSCLLCKHVKGPRLIQRPYGPTFTAKRRNEALHWDFTYLGDAFDGDCYILVLKDSLTHYCEFSRVAVRLPSSRLMR
ncbi:hypothetical protein PHMEG_00028534 [Phytophthora megakarya]|uniref:Integrase zinc-binding domain-containing protein n=1 Tax=Phytophthora megakarya TaxID=4795 RepID=A0A225V4S8_9STRA|nr:hypothetical protein PHMEG_00028534 [Phytophthora megakarya]